MWIEADPDEGPHGEERLIALYTRQQGLQFPDGLALFDDAQEISAVGAHALHERACFLASFLA